MNNIERKKNYQKTRGWWIHRYSRSYKNRRAITKKKKSSTKTIIKRSPRFTAHGQGNVNLNADAPKTRVGWVLAIIAVCILIILIPWLLVQSLGISLDSGLNGIWNWLTQRGNDLSNSLSDWWISINQPALGSDLYSNAVNGWNDFWGVHVPNFTSSVVTTIQDWIESWKWW